MQSYTRLLERQATLVVAVFVIFVGAGLMSVSRQGVTYRAEAKLVVPVPVAVDIDTSESPLAAICSLGPGPIEIQVQAVQSPAFLQDALRRSGSGASQVSVRAERLPDTSVLRIVVEGPDGATAAAIANAVVDLHRQRMSDSATENLSRALAFVRQQRAWAGERLAGLEARSIRLRRRLGLRKASAELRELQHDQILLEGACRSLEHQQQLLELRDSGSPPGIKVIERANAPRRPSGFRGVGWLALWALAGLVAASGAAAAKDRWDRTRQSADPQLW